MAVCHGKLWRSAVEQGRFRVLVRLAPESVFCVLAPEEMQAWAQAGAQAMRMEISACGISMVESECKKEV